jgi:hypothetical protein
MPAPEDAYAQQTWQLARSALVRRRLAALHQVDADTPDDSAVTPDILDATADATDREPS